jgi:hypothetical protein
MNMNPILSYFKQTWIFGSYKPETWNYFDHIGRKTNNDVERALTQESPTP